MRVLNWGREESLIANCDLAPKNEAMRRVYLPEKAKKKVYVLRVRVKAELINSLEYDSEV